MERSFIKLFLQETRFPPEACRAVLEAWDRVEAAGRLPALRGAVEAYLRSFSTEETQSALEALSEGCGVPVYTLGLLLLADGLGKLPLMARAVRGRGTDLIPQLIACLLPIALGILLVANPFRGVRAVIMVFGVGLLIDGASDLATALLARRAEGGG